jgi:ribosomal protein L15E
MSTVVHGAAPLASPYKRQTPTLLQVVGRSIWRALEAAGQRRAARELHNLAQRWEPFDPALARQLREASLHDTRG